MFNSLLKKIHYKLERICVKHASKTLKAMRENKKVNKPLWFEFVSKYEFKLRKKLYPKKD